jgi:AraC-like DNA-binding protein
VFYFLYVENYCIGKGNYVDPDKFLIFKVLEETLKFEYCGGAVTRLRRPFSTSWRTLPYATSAQAIGGTLRVEALEGRPVEIKEGGGMLSVAGLRHKIDLVAPEQLTTRWSHFNFFVLASMDVLSLLEVPLVLGRKAAGTIGDINEELAGMEVSEERLPIRRIARKKELGFRLLSIITEISAIKPRSVEILQSSRRLFPVLQFVKDNLARDFDREEMARVVHLSASRFHTLFKNIMGIAPMNYVQALRMKTAQMILIQTDWPISRIAKSVGHNDQFHFSRLFKQTCGTNPSDYRKNAGKSLN